VNLLTDPAVAGIVINLHDVTARKQVEEFHASKFSLTAGSCPFSSHARLEARPRVTSYMWLTKLGLGPFNMGNNWHEVGKKFLSLPRTSAVTH